MAAIVKRVVVPGEIATSRLGSLLMEATIAVGAKTEVVYGASPAKGWQKGNECGTDLGAVSASVCRRVFPKFYYLLESSC
jgi:hypothetical protein